VAVGTPGKASHATAARVQDACLDDSVGPGRGVGLAELICHTGRMYYEMQD
jgi:hypothetical protein